MSKKQKKMLIRILIASALMILLNVLKLPKEVSAGLYFVSYLVIGYDILRKAWKGILNRRPFDECFLMAVATLGAIGLALYEKSGDYNEAVAVMLFYQIGEFFQSYAVGKSRRNIAELMDIRPDYANVETDGVLTQVDPDEVEIGTVIVVQPGEKVPIDGVILEGRSTLNTSALTGESAPRECREGDEIISGCINLSGLLKVRTTKEFGESTVSKILELVENASSRKSSSEEFISRFARIYTPAVVYSALALAILPPLVRGVILGLPAEWNVWLYRALTFLVISCPCALVISIPLSFFAGIGGASHEGILVKGSNYLETLSRVKTVVFDKTGTLTQGVFEVSGIHHSPMEDERLLELAALVECASSHPISKSLQRAYGKETDRSLVTDIEEIGGEGVVGTVDGHRVAAGNDKLMRRLGLDYQECRSVGNHHPHGRGRRLCGAYCDLGSGKAECERGDPRTARCGDPTAGHADRGRREGRRPCGKRPRHGRIPCSAAPGGQGQPGGETPAGKQRQARETCLCRGRNQRRTGALPGGYRHRHGRDGLGCRH